MPPARQLFGGINGNNEIIVLSRRRNSHDAQSVAIGASLRYNTTREAGMKKNMGNVDRVLRLVAAVAVAVLIALKVFTGTLLVVLVIVAAMFLVTSAIGFCPLYVPLRISTIPRKKE
jgi:uncharacterized membrane protein